MDEAGQGKQAVALREVEKCEDEPSGRMVPLGLIDDEVEEIDEFFWASDGSGSSELAAE